MWTGLRLLAVALAGIVLAGAARAQSPGLALETFFGTFAGSGVAETPDSLYFGTTARDLDVTIGPEGPEGKNFRVRWTSVIRSGGGAKPDARRKTATRVFEPTGRAGVYRGAAADPLAGGEIAWARLAGNTLTVYLLVVRADGRYEIQKYDRTLMDTGMKLEFTRLRDGAPVRRVTGRLIKTRN